MKVAKIAETIHLLLSSYTAQKMKFPIKDFSSKCDQIRRKLQTWSHLQKKFVIKYFIFYAVLVLFSKQQGMYKK